MLDNTSQEFFTPFYPKNSDGSTNLCTSLLIYKEIGRICLNGKHLIKAEFVRYKHDTHKYLYDMRFEQEINGLTNTFYLDTSRRSILDEDFRELARGTLVS
ncbi:hypothetical protein [Acinetobacter vivianii]|uniref:hypothetical protein n=1 Tax=Acinetobacter vivianii TaxID=1776742 RepID=UPI003D04130D